MSRDPVHLAVDLGASGGRVIAGSVQQGKLSLETAHRFANTPTHVQSTMCWNTVQLWQEIKAGLAKAASDADSVRSVGVDSWGVDYVLLSADERPVGPAVHYRDERNRGMVERAFEIVPREEIFAATGLQFMEINTLYQLLSMKLSDAPQLKIADGFVMMADFFHWLLTGKRSVEYTNASTSGLLDPRSGDWCWDLIDRFELPKSLFGPILQPGTNLAPVQASVARETGLQDVPVILPATHDTASAVLAAPAENFASAQPNWCYISSGTWSLMGCELPQPLINETCSQLNFTNEGGIQGSTRLLKNIGGLWIFQQIRASLERRGEAVSWEAMVQAAQTARPFALLIDPDHADFKAPDDMVEAIRVFAKRTGQADVSEPAVLYRAALEGLALRYRVCLGMLETLVGNPIDTIHVMGGGCLNKLLCQMTADACRRPVIAGPVEATATGNVLMQMIGCGELKSVAEARQLVRNSFSLQRYEPQDSVPWDEAVERFQRLADG